MNEPHHSLEMEIGRLIGHMEAQTAAIEGLKAEFHTANENLRRELSSDISDQKAEMNRRIEGSHDRIASLEKKVEDLPSATRARTGNYIQLVIALAAIAGVAMHFR